MADPILSPASISPPVLPPLLPPPAIVPTPTPTTISMRQTLLLFAALLLGVAGWQAYKFIRPVAPTPTPSPDIRPIAPNGVINAPVGKMTTVRLSDGLPGDELWWLNPVKQKESLQVVEYIDHAVVCPQADGPLTFGVTIFRGGAFTTLTWRVETNTGPIPPPPTPPIPPGPTPPTPPIPVPPGPNPQPNPSPISEVGLRVLIVFDKSDSKSLTVQQGSIIYGQDFRTWLDEKCAVGPKTDSPKEWRIFDKGQDPSGDNPKWGLLLRLLANTSPGICITNGKSWYAGPLPADVPKTKELISKYTE